MNMQNDPFTESFFKMHVIWKLEAIYGWFFFTYFTFIYLFFKFIPIFNPKQGSITLYHKESRTWKNTSFNVVYKAIHLISRSWRYCFHIYIIFQWRINFIELPNNTLNLWLDIQDVTPRMAQIIVCILLTHCQHRYMYILHKFSINIIKVNKIHTHKHVYKLIIYL